MSPVFGYISHYIFGFLMTVTAIFLILLVLVQRGRGGGLAGAFGGLGGQSAFGAKAGDTFTRITMVAATFWILLCILAIRVLNTPSSRFGEGGGAAAPPPAGAAPSEPGAQPGPAPAESESGAGESPGEPGSPES